MIWIVALLCLGFSGLVGFYQGPIRGGFSLLGLVFGSFLASPLSRVIKPLLTAVGVKHPIWSQVLPLVIAFIAVVIVFKIIGSMVHQKVMFSHKYGEDDARFYRWERVFQRLGAALGLFCGAFYFFVIMMPIYVGGYFTVQFASGEDDPASVRLVNSLRTDLQDLKLDRVLASYDPTPAQVYKAGDTVALVLKNRILESRLSHYPVFLTLSERPEFQDLATDVEFQKLFNTQATARDLLNYPKVQGILANHVLTTELIHLVGDNLDDLYDYLNTGKSAKYDSEKILGTWVINPAETVAQERKKGANLTALQFSQRKAQVTSQILGLSLIATTDNQAILKKEAAGPASVLARGTWQKTGDNYQVILPGSTPEMADAVALDDQLQFVRNGIAMVFDREL